MEEEYKPIPVEFDLTKAGIEQIKGYLEYKRKEAKAKDQELKVLLRTEPKK